MYVHTEHTLEFVMLNIHAFKTRVGTWFGTNWNYQTFFIEFDVKIKVQEYNGVYYIISKNIGLWYRIIYVFIIEYDVLWQSHCIDGFKRRVLFDLFNLCR